MRDATFDAANGTKFNFNLTSFAAEKATWDKQNTCNNCYNFGTARHNKKGIPAVPGRAGRYNDKYADELEQIIKGVLADGGIFLGFDGNDEQYGARMPKITDNAGTVFLMAVTRQSGSEYHFFRLFDDGWYEKDGTQKAPTKVKPANIPKTKADYTALFCDKNHPDPVGYFLILPTHVVNGTIDVNFGA